MLTATQMAGFIGVALAGAAYVPQISHLVRTHCSAGISRVAFGVWLGASLLVTTHALATGARVFIVLGGVQIAATTVILVYATRYASSTCRTHRPAAFDYPEGDRESLARSAMDDGSMSGIHVTSEDYLDLEALRRSPLQVVQVAGSIPGRQYDIPAIGSRYPLESTPGRRCMVPRGRREAASVAERDDPAPPEPRRAQTARSG